MFCATFQQSPLSKITLAGTYRDRHKERRYQVGILEQCSGGVGLTHNGKEYVEQALGFKGIDLCLYRRLAESEQARDAYADALSKKYRAAFDERPVADVALDQAQCTVQTAFRRALLCLATAH